MRNSITAFCCLLIVGFGKSFTITTGRARQIIQLRRLNSLFPDYTSDERRLTVSSLLADEKNNFSEEKAKNDIDMNEIMERIKAEGSAQPKEKVRTAGSGEGYTWFESDRKMFVRIPISRFTKASAVQVDINPTSIAVYVKGGDVLLKVIVPIATCTVACPSLSDKMSIVTVVHKGSA